jgi:polysaccharide pyruvyl transferase WcaK-like protein
VKIVACGGGFAGKGAEAMLLTVRSELMSRLPDAEFHLWRCSENEQRMAADAGFKSLFWPGSVRSFGWRALRKVGLDAQVWSALELRRGPRVPRGREAQSVGDQMSVAYAHYLDRVGIHLDAIIDVSGFAYGDDWGVERLRWNRPLADYSQTRGVPFVYMPQAWGTFERPEVAREARSMLGRAGTVLYSRDEESSRHLESLLDWPTGSTPWVPDVALLFRGGTKEQAREILSGMRCTMDRPIVTVAPNMRVYERMPGSGGDNAYIRTLAALVRHCLDEYDVDVVLQANEYVLSGAVPDDRYACAAVAGVVARPDRCFTSENVLSAAESAALVGASELVLGSRYHSLVFALAQGVPVVAIGWSHKYAGLMNSFGLERYSLALSNIDIATLVGAADRAWSERAAVAAVVRESAASQALKLSDLFDDLAARVQPATETDNARPNR